MVSDDAAKDEARLPRGCLFTRRYPDYRYRGRRKMGGHSRPLRCGSERKKQNASYVLMVFQPRNSADSFGTSQFDGRKEMV
ncbi:jg27568 [Pararge aegeria aegeria]|uniref:Jg27568 protein n=1 Tax=Pararge aegeria aegeria TaxID=348720 RepID=A0A8S4SMW3_9NEOP|nr:jg27568 [Pararge aegeria aegeria]